MNRFRYIFVVVFLFVCVSSLAQTDIPDEPEFLSASVTPESWPTTVVLDWKPSDSLDVEGYIIYKVISGVTETIDTVDGRLNTEYSYNASVASTSPEKFRLAAIDASSYKSSITDPHTTMNLIYEYDKCTMEVNLDWTEYVGWGESGVIAYKIYRREETMPYVVIESQSSDKRTFNDTGLDYNTVYYYYIEAIRIDGTTATSNSKSVLTESFTLPSFMLAEYATVTGDDISVKFVVDHTAEVLEYQIQRSSSPDGGFSSIKSVANIGQGEIIYTDNNVSVDENRYYYRLASLNPCGIVSSYSNVCSNIILNVESSEGLEHALDWTEYYAWPNGVSNYKVYRYFEGVSYEISVNTPGSLNYLDNIESYVDLCHDKKTHMTNKFCYYVEAYESENSGFDSNLGVSRSNVACVNHYPVAWFPSAFNVTSYEPENRVFKPVLSFVEAEPYEFVVFDKWGAEIFRTNETYEGWNGDLDYNLAPSQYYTYYVRYFDHKGSEYIKTGTFFLLVE